MDWLTPREKKIFITVFLVLALFVQWYGVNGNSRLDLTRAMVEDGDLDINGYYNNTGDRSIYKGDYYSDKSPGMSFLAVPVYYSAKKVYGLFGDNTVGKTPRMKLFTVNEKVDITVPANPGNFYLISLILITLLTSTLAVSILTVLIYRITGDIIEDESKRLLLTFGFAFGTLITHYGTLFLPNAVSTLFAFSTFYLLYQWEEYPGERKMMFAGLLGGFAVVVDTITGLILVANAAYALLKFRRLPISLAIGGFIGGLPFMVYNTVAFGAPWNLPRSFLDPVIWKNLQNNIGFRFGPVRNFFVTLRLIFMPYRGIFYWFPVLILGLIGLKEMRRSDKITSYTVAGIFSAVVLVVGGWWAWWHGGWFGARHLVLLMPFIMIPAAYAVKKIDMQILVLLVGISISVNAVGFQSSYEDMLKDRDNSSQMIPEAKQKLESFQPLANPLKSYYLAQLSERGLDSRLLDGLARGEIPDIRKYSEDHNTSELLLGYALLFIVLGVWHRDVFQHLKSHRKKVLATTESPRTREIRR